ncbi:head-tail connector protein [Brevundimonas sp.]|uniref:head-tail connector protein n=1 Tax=Brevundimonas sp. TaxID=1871086 RepID=UPI0035AE1424
MLTRTRNVKSDETLITLVDAKRHLNLGDYTGDDAYIRTLIEAAHDFIETAINHTLITEEAILTLDCLPEIIEIRARPVQAVVSISYRDGEGEVQVLDPQAYYVDVDQTPAIIAVKPGAPRVQARPGAVKIALRLGFADDSEGVPGDLKQAARSLIGHWYRNREAVSDTPMTDVSQSAAAIIARYRIPVFE